ncbi:MAG: lipopolysaccharide assembly LapA domain-containing protein [Microcystaceae cyanobacterium]
MQYFFLILALFISFFFVVFALQNAEPVTIDFILTQVESSLALILVITLALGIFIGLLVSSFSLIKQRLEIAKQNKQLKELQKLSESPSESIKPEILVTETDEQTNPS